MFQICQKFNLGLRFIGLIIYTKLEKKKTIKFSYPFKSQADGVAGIRKTMQWLFQTFATHNEEDEKKCIKIYARDRVDFSQSFSENLFRSWTVNYQANFIYLMPAYHEIKLVVSVWVKSLIL
jgi:hypothetical protein